MSAWWLGVDTHRDPLEFFHFRGHVLCERPDILSLFVECDSNWSDQDLLRLPSGESLPKISLFWHPQEYRGFDSVSCLQESILGRSTDGRLFHRFLVILFLYITHELGISCCFWTWVEESVFFVGAMRTWKKKQAGQDLGARPRPLWCLGKTLSKRFVPTHKTLAISHIWLPPFPLCGLPLSTRLFIFNYYIEICFFIRTFVFCCFFSSLSSAVGKVKMQYFVY